VTGAHRVEEDEVGQVEDRLSLSISRPGGLKSMPAALPGL